MFEYQEVLEAMAKEAVGQLETLQSIYNRSPKVLHELNHGQALTFLQHGQQNETYRLTFVSVC